MGKVSGSGTATILVSRELEGVNPKFVSRRFQLLPSDFSVDDDGKVTLTSSYINNVHPTRHKELYSVIPEILQHALPMFEHVLSDLLRPLLPMRIETSGGYGFGDRETIDCIQGGKYNGDLKVMDNRISLKSRTLQVIVKLANIVLTPERPRYPGGKWHVEGSSQSVFFYGRVGTEFFKPSRLAERDDRFQFHICEFRPSDKNRGS